MNLNRVVLNVFVSFLLISVANVAFARPSTFLPAEKEVFAIGDLHGDYSAMVSILRAAKLIDGSNNWIGGSKTLVQVGDQLDRGDTEKQILDLFENLIVQAQQSGGQVLVLNGNHETMNVELDFRYVTTGGFRQFEGYYNNSITDSDVVSLPSSQRGRAVAFKPGGPYAKVLSEHNAIVMVGRTVFVHGGITPSHARYGIDNINAEISEWMKGYSREPSSVGGSGPLWNRDYGDDTLSASDCQQLNETLSALNASRMVIAHTRQRSINQACDGKVWRVDVGMASYYGGRLQALKITNDDLIQIVNQNGSISDTGFGGGGGSQCDLLTTPNDPVASNVTTSSFTVSWIGVAGADSYLIKRWDSAAGEWVDYKTVAETSLQVTGVQDEKVYLTVTALSDCGERSGTSGYVTITMQVDGGQCEALAKPNTPVASSITSSSYTISWDGVSGADRYLVKRWNEAKGAWEEFTTTTDTKISVTDEQESVVYFNVSALNSCGEASTASSYVTVTLTDGSGGGSGTCPSGYTHYNGTLNADGKASPVDGGYYYASSYGTHGMENIGTSLTMSFYKWKSSQWELKRSSTTSLSYTSTEGYYYPYLSGTPGATYDICLKRP
ncbi:hypothetical protein DU002_14705 [Corallincola holothuriorum]|uniref:Fibronectin type-III domain-containing protein n=1 Tax=Corallincola holothuriorum TaxID=2282215 RepID=A0A368N663_9GAMM|nr:metallophosphoesterase [Corallincola holothuriorum]RCU45706.1 hypothetical protein DU002_14705 [Corallincola holothuriorum]